MRLWHQKLISELPTKQLVSQHCEICAMRGNGWGKKHSVVDYVFEYDMEVLVAFHQLVIDEMLECGHNPNLIWRDYNYRGKNCEPFDCDEKMVNLILDLDDNIYSEHDNKYYWECLSNLSAKGVEMEVM